MLAHRGTPPQDVAKPVSGPSALTTRLGPQRQADELLKHMHVVREPLPKARRVCPVVVLRAPVINRRRTQGKRLLRLLHLKCLAVKRMACHTSCQIFAAEVSAAPAPRTGTADRAGSATDSSAAARRFA